MDPPKPSAFVGQEMDTTSLPPGLSKLSAFALSCIDFFYAYHGPASSTSSTNRDSSQLSVSDKSGGSPASTGSHHAVSNFEASSYYLGISYDHPHLLFRTGSEKYPFVRPTGSQAYRTSKSVRGVYGTPLNAIWGTVGPLVRDLIKIQKIRYTSIDVARFITHDTDKEDVPGPVVIWIGVYPGSTTADTAHDTSEDILGLLKGHGIEGVEIEWRESVFWCAVGPPLLRTVGLNHTTVDVRGPLTATLGVPIATAERPDAQGSVGFFFHEGKDKEGNISDRVFAVSCRHVLLATTKIHNVEYELKGAGSHPKHVRLHSFRRFRRLLDDIKLRIGSHGTMIDLYSEEIARLEAEEKSEDPEVAAEDKEGMEKTRQKLARGNKGITDLEKFYTDVVKDWSDSEHRNIGTVHYSPAIAFNVKPEGFTEDWGTFVLDEDRWKAQFRGNVLDLGTKIPVDKLIAMMYPRIGGRKAFKYPAGRQLRINGIASKELLANPDLLDDNNQPCLIVVKDGNTTDFTVGRATGMVSFVRDDSTGEESTELAIYNYNKQSGVFSAKGDSGSLIVDGLGRMVGLLRAGTSRGGFEAADVTYATPIWWLWPRIKAKYPHADLNRVTWSAA